MTVCLVTSATLTELTEIGKAERAATQRMPLGVLCLASVLGNAGIDTEIVDVDRLFVEWLRGGDGDSEKRDFSVSVATRLAGMDVCFFGFSSICSSYPLTLRIASALKQLRPDAHITLGGPQATAAAAETLQAFPAVDVVVRGEGEVALPVLLGKLGAREDLRPVPGIVFRRSGEIVRNPDSPLLTDLDSLPMPAFHLLTDLKEHDFLAVEVGRGCPFSCTFCSTGQFFRHSFRTKTVQRVVQEISRLREEYGVDTFEFIQDNFTLDRKRVVEFCQALLTLGSKIRWSCSARTDCIDDALIDLMHRAGCRDIFLGVESGSERMQGLIRKGLDIEAARERIRHANRRKVGTTVSLIAGFHEETMEDLGKTVRFFVDALRYDYVDPQLTLLSPLTGTPIHLRHKDQLIFDDVISEMAFQGVQQDAQERELIAAHPAVFSSFYSIPTPWLDRRYLDELRYFLLSTRFDFRWLLVALEQISGDILRVFELWQAWRAAFDGAKRDSCLRTYYAGSAFRREFLAFVRQDLTKEYPTVAHVLLALVEYLEGLEADGCRTDLPPESTELPGALREMRGLPVRAERVHVTRLSADFSRIVRCLRRRGQLSRIPGQESTVVTRIRNERTEIIQLSSESAELLKLCDGSRDVRAVRDAFGGSGRNLEGVPRSRACLVGLELLRQQRLIRILSPERGSHSPTPSAHMPSLASPTWK